MAGIELSGMSANAVVPPAAIAEVPLEKPSQCVRPGSFRCTCASTNPGSTCRPRASTSSRPPVSSGPTCCDHAVAAADVAARRAVREVDGAAADDEIERHAASRSAIRRRMILTISSSATASSISGSCASRSSYAWRIASFDHSRTQITNGNPNRAR